MELSPYYMAMSGDQMKKEHTRLSKVANDLEEAVMLQTSQEGMDKLDDQKDAWSSAVEMGAMTDKLTAEKKPKKK